LVVIFFFFFFYGATSPYRALASLIKPLHSRLDSRFRDFLRWEVVSLSPNPQSGGPEYLSGMGGSTSSHATAGIALKVVWPHKPHHYVKVETPEVVIEASNILAGWVGLNYKESIDITWAWNWLILDRKK
jgi:hypothetical protein